MIYVDVSLLTGSLTYGIVCLIQLSCLIILTFSKIVWIDLGKFEMCFMTGGPTLLVLEAALEIIK
jgi:hypothetical protein